MLSQAEKIRGWVARNGCEAPTTTTVLADVDPHDGTRTRREDYCAGSAGPVSLLAVEGGEHTWPGGRQYLPRAVIGATSRDFDATEVIWEFLRRQALP